MAHFDQKKNKLLTVSHNLNYEGATISLFDITNAFSEMPDVEASFISFSDGDMASKYEDNGIPRISLPFNEEELKHSSSINNAIRGLRKTLEEVKPDVVFVNTILGYPMVHAASQMGIPVLWIIRESQSIDFWNEYLGDRVELVLEAFKYASRLVFVADSTQQLWMSQTDVRTSSCIPNALNKNTFGKEFSDSGKFSWRKKWGIPQEAILFLCVGTFHERKGQMDLVDMMASMGKVNEEVVIVCVGDSGGEYSRQLKCRTAALNKNLQEKLIFIDRQENVGDAYNSADVFVCCSRNESYPRVTLEAMECGLPIISTSVYGLKEQLEFGVNALEYSPGDIDQLCRNVRLFSEDKSLRIKYGESSKKRINNLPGFNQMINKYREVFDSLLVG